MKIMVTGGAGFIGSHIVDRLIKEGHKVVSVDNLSLGNKENHKGLFNNPNFEFVKLDLNNKEKLLLLMDGVDIVFHMAANSDIQKGAKYTDVDLNNTFLSTFNVLDCMKEKGVKNIIFSSTSAIYGENYEKLHENVGPLQPISFYGAAKLASEGYITAYGENYNIKSWIFRFPNVVGPRLSHGAIFDFIKKLKKNPKELEILGDGTQEKPYIYVTDLVDAMIYGWKNSNDKLNVFNVGVDTKTKVSMLAQIVVEEMGLQNVKFKYTGGDRGWVGDVPKFEYDLSKIHSLGWTAKHDSDKAVRLTVRAELENMR